MEEALARFSGGEGEIKSQVHPSRDVNGDENGKDYISFGLAIAHDAARPEGTGGSKDSFVYRRALRTFGYAHPSTGSRAEAGKRQVMPGWGASFRASPGCRYGSAVSPSRRAGA